MAETQADIAQYQTDHDLLIELRTEMRGVRVDIKNMTDTTADKISDHETRIRLSEKQLDGMEATNRTWRYITTTALTVLGIAIAVIGLILSKI